MHKSQKRIMSIVMAAAMSVCVVPQAANEVLSPALIASADDTVPEGLQYSINDERTAATITKYTGTASELDIPGTVENVPVTAVAEWAFAKNETLTKVILPDSITEIGNSAFSLCAKLTSVTFPANLKTIGNNAFSSCGELLAAELKNGVTSIGNGTFSSCSKLASITIPKSVTSIGEAAFRSTAWLAAQQAKNSLVIFNHILIDGTTASGDVVVPDTVTGICNQAFIGCKNMTSIRLPAGLKNLNDDLFKECAGLKTVILPDGLTRIGSNAFIECKELTEINIPDSVSEIGPSAFYGCTKLASVHLPASLTVLTSGTQQGLFQACSALTDIEIPKSVTAIGRTAFAQCENLKWVLIPESVKSIDTLAFYGCKNVKICGAAGSAAEAYANQKNIPFIPIEAAFSGISLSLADDLALNFFADGVTADNKDNYKVVFSGKCEEDGKDTAFTEKDGRYCASANVSAIHMGETITAKLYCKNGETWEMIGKKEYSVNQYLNNTAAQATWSSEKTDAFNQLVNTVKLYGEVSYAYFKTPANLPAVTSHTEEIKAARERDNAARDEGRDKKEKAIAEYKRGYYAANKEAIAEYQRGYRAAGSDLQAEQSSLRQWRRERNYSQAIAARRLKVSQSTISNIERGIQPMSEAIREAISR